MAAQTPAKADVVKLVRGVLDSSPDSISQPQLESDFRTICGKSLKVLVNGLGFASVDSFLCNLAKEGKIKLTYGRNGEHMFGAAVADASTVHLQKLVKNQREKKKKKPPPKGVTSSRVHTPAKCVLPSHIKANIVQVVKEKGPSINSLSFGKLYHDMFGSQFNFKNYGFSTLVNALSSIDEVKITQEQGQILISSVLHSESFYTTSLASGEKKKQLSQKIKKVLEQSHDKKVLLTEFASCYEKVHGREISAAEYGYSSLLHMVADMDDAVILHRNEQDWIISLAMLKTDVAVHKEDSKMPVRISASLLHDIKETLRNSKTGVFLPSFRQAFQNTMGYDIKPADFGFSSVKDLLVVIGKDDIEIVGGNYDGLIRLKSSKTTTETPSKVSGLSLDINDAVGPGVLYNSAVVPPIDQYIKVIVSHINTPSNFYVQVLSNDNAGKRLEELMDLLEQVYSQAESRKYLLPSEFATPGQLVVCKYPNDDNWHRACITKVIDANFVQVIFVDYGTMCAVHISQLYYLRQRFLQMPMQAHHCTLFGILPANGKTWTPSATRAFLNLTADSKRLCALVLNVEFDGKLSLVLTDTSQDVDIHINDYLVSSTFANFIDNSQELPLQDLSEVANVTWSDSSNDDDDDLENEDGDYKYKNQSSNVEIRSQTSPKLNTHLLPKISRSAEAVSSVLVQANNEDVFAPVGGTSSSALMAPAPLSKVADIPEFGNYKISPPQSSPSKQPAVNSSAHSPISSGQIAKFSMGNWLPPGSVEHHNTQANKNLSVDGYNHPTGALQMHSSPPCHPTVHQRVGDEYGVPDVRATKHSHQSFPSSQSAPSYNNNSSGISSEQIKYKLKSLELKHKRLLRGRYDSNGDSEDTSSVMDDVEAVAKEIAACKLLLSHEGGKEPDRNVTAKGRGRGSLLLALATDS